MAIKKTVKDRLSAGFVRTISKPGTYGDGGRGGNGLELRVFIRVLGILVRVFQQRLRVDGKQIRVQIGEYPDVSLAEARDIAVENARLAREGIDPRRKKDEKKNEKDVPPTFAEAVELVIAERRETWKLGSSSERSWRGTIKRHALPKIGQMRVDEITEEDIIDMLKPLWRSNKIRTAKYLRSYTNIIMSWCRREKLRSDNPVTALVSEFAPKGIVKHYPFVPYYEVASALKKIRECGWAATTRLAQEFQIFTACRHGSIRKARWSEIDWENKIWTSPDEHMKADRTLRVPLSTGAMAVLEKALPFKKGDSDLIFPSLSPQSAGGIIRGTALPNMCQDLGLPGTPHGFRGTFGTWCAEMGVNSELRKAALAHAPDEVDDAYIHSDFLERRKPLMQAWSDYIEGKLPDSWRWREGDDELIERLREAQAEIRDLRAELAALKAK